MAVLSNIVVYAGGYIFLVFIAVCLATGLYYIAEMVEEYTRLTRKVLDWSIKISIALNVALLVVDRLPFLCIAVSIVSQLAYTTLLKRFPFIEVSSVEFIGSLGMLALNHFVWMRHFRAAVVHHSMEYLLGFFLMVVWIVPFGFFISLAANESVLPSGGLAGSGGGLGGGAASGGGLGGGGVGMPAGAFGTFADAGKKKRANVILQVLDFGKAQWDRVAKRSFPNGLPGTYKERNL